MVVPTEKFKYVFFVYSTNMEELLENIKKILNSADLVYSSEDYTSAAILYFKAAFSAIDYILLSLKGKSPKDHTERFRIVEKEFPDLYTFLDKSFSVYRDTYSTSIDKETCDKVKEDVRSILQKYKIQI